MPDVTSEGDALACGAFVQFVEPCQPPKSCPTDHHCNLERLEYVATISNRHVILAVATLD
jgi:hypothetical protein